MCWLNETSNFSNNQLVLENVLKNHRREVAQLCSIFFTVGGSEIQTVFLQNMIFLSDELFFLYPVFLLSVLAIV